MSITKWQPGGIPLPVGDHLMTCQGCQHVLEWALPEAESVHVSDGLDHLQYGKWMMSGPGNSLPHGFKLALGDDYGRLVYGVYLPQAAAVHLRDQLNAWWPESRYPAAT